MGGSSRDYIPSHCACGETVSLNHALSCSKGAMPSIRHNCIRDLLAQFLTEVCPNVAIEPALQPLTGETFPHRSTNTDDGARLDVKAQNFWDSNRSSAFFDVRVFNSRHYFLLPCKCIHNVVLFYSCVKCTTSTYTIQCITIYR